MPRRLNDRGTSLFELRRSDEAFADLIRAIEVDPECADYHWNLALMRLRIGEFDAGWLGREWGRKVAVLGFVDRKFTQPQWLGGPIAGKTILLHSDEGLGDTIQFSRYATMVSQLGARVILEVELPLHGLLTGMEGVALCLPKVDGRRASRVRPALSALEPAARLQDAAGDHTGAARLSAAAAGSARGGMAGAARRA